MPSPLSWVRPTLRSTNVVPTILALVVSAALLVALDLVDVAVRAPWLGPLVLALLTSAVVLGLHDPAHALLAALPSGTGTRLLHRLVLLSSLAVAGALALEVLARATPTVALTAPTLLTFGPCAVAAVVVAFGRHPVVAPSAGAAVPIGWVIWAATTPHDGPLAPVAHLWHRQPTVTAGTALAVAVVVSMAGGRPVRQKVLDLVNRGSRSVAQRR